MTRPLTVAVTGMNAVPDNPGPGLAVARCLRAAWAARAEPLRIVGLGYDALDAGLYLDEYCNSAHLLPYPAAGAEAVLERLTAIHRRDPFDILIPCLDAELPVVIGLGPALKALGIATWLPDAAQLARRAKDRLPELATIAQVDCPEIRAVSQPGFFYSCEREDWRYPLVVKGVFYDAQVVANAAEGATAFQRIAAAWGLPVLVQRFVAGEECNLAAVGDGEGNLLGAVMMKKRAVTAKGKAWAGIAIDDAVLGDAAARLAAALRWRGPLEVEVMRDTGGKYHLIEINPRFPAWIYLSHGVGRNLPALLLDLIQQRPLPQLPPPQPGTLFIRYALETIVPLAAFEDLMMDGSAVPGNKDTP